MTVRCRSRSSPLPTQASRAAGFYFITDTTLHVHEMCRIVRHKVGASDVIVASESYSLLAREPAPSPTEVITVQLHQRSVPSTRLE